MYPSGVLIPIQGLRAIAALGVVLHHVQYEARTRLGMPDALPYFEYGALGVDLFFVVSGFVMVYASGPLFAKAEGARIFMARRIIRIVPLYWLCTGVYVAFALLAPQLARTHYGADVVAASLLFYPYERPDIGMFPVVGQGWTLNYEMLFYAVFSACILLPRRQAVLAVAAVFAALSITGRTVDLPQPFAFWASPIILEFVLGAVLGLLYVEGWCPPPPPPRDRNCVARPKFARRCVLRALPVPSNLHPCRQRGRDASWRGVSKPVGLSGDRHRVRLDRCRRHPSADRTARDKLAA
jgi:peptidoglycan/LPS O-acetylase OafA/YrhL